MHFFAMQFIDGESIASLIARQRRASAPAGSQEPTAASGASPVETTAPLAGKTAESALRDVAYFHKIAEWGIQAAEALEHAHGLVSFFSFAAI